MAMKQNRLRYLLDNGLPSVATRLVTPQSVFIEALGDTGNYDYVEFLAEYTPFTQYDLQSFCITSELHDMGSMIKIDFQNRAYVAQKAIASGFQAVLFTDCHDAQEVRESIRLVKPETPEDGGRFGYPNNRFIGFQPRIGQLDHARRQREVVLAFMIEKESAVADIERICAVPGVDMVQFGPSDYSMSRGWNAQEHFQEFKAAERTMIQTALRHGVHPRCEIQTVEAAHYYIDLGVKHFCLGDQLGKLMEHWSVDGGAMRRIVGSLPNA